MIMIMIMIIIIMISSSSSIFIIEEVREGGAALGGEDAGEDVLRQGADACAYRNSFTLRDCCVSSLRSGHANLLRIVPILTEGRARLRVCISV